jgi:hypothetical protein
LEIVVRKSTLLAILAGLLAAAATMYISYTSLKVPQIPLDWAALVFSGLTTGLIAFFIVWGHFQKSPEPDQHDPS